MPSAVNLLWPIVLVAVTGQASLTGGTATAVAKGLHGGIVLTAVGSLLLDRPSSAPVVTSALAALSSTIVDTPVFSALTCVAVAVVGSGLPETAAASRYAHRLLVLLRT